MKNYSLNQHVLNFAGIDIEEDVGKVSLKPTGKIYTPRNGNDGTTTTSENLGNKNHTGELELGYGSKTHLLLSAFFNAVLAAGGGTAGVSPFLLKDLQGLSVVTTLEAYIEGWPDQERAGEVGLISWPIFLVQPTIVIGGLSG
jgi:hypothetical protein